MTPRGWLVVIKLIHTVVWAFFAACIIAIPIAALARRFALAAFLIGTILVEVAILLANRWACPMTGVAARYTADRSANFDIYLPERLARHNKLIFGSLYVVGIAITVFLWTLEPT